MNSEKEIIKAGFWIRLLATWVDCLIIYFVLTAILYLLIYTAPELYFPFNFTFFVAGLIYSSILVAWKGQTAGKYLLGISVQSNTGTRLSFLRSVLRETILKIVSGVVLFLGFFWIGFTKNKKGWHDHIVHSSVVKNDSDNKATPFWKIIVLASFIFFWGNYIWDFTSTVIDAKRMDMNPASIKLPFMDRDPSSVTDVSAVTDTSFVSWLDKNEQSPEAYALQVTSAHQVTLFGEMHENADNLIFLNHLIAPLYHKSGIRVIAMEIIPASMNKKVEQLINGKSYDRDLAMEIARSQCWKMWGFKEYWDVLETVWKLNHSLADTAEKMRVIGLDADWEMPNLSLLGTSQDSKGKTAFWEKFRIFSAIGDFPKYANRDKLMARNIEKEIISKHQKAVVWIGFNHTLINVTATVQRNNKLVAVNPRFAVLLSQKYKNTFFQVELYQRFDLNDSDSIPVYTNSIDNFLDSVMRLRNNKPAGFSIALSPFEKLRDKYSPFFSQSPSVCYGDVAQGLIFLKPFSASSRCNWIPGYISDKMFMKYKPMYDLVFGKNEKIKFRNATELNEVLVKWLGQN